jgi:hypothetical protein
VSSINLRAATGVIRTEFPFGEEPIDKTALVLVNTVEVAEIRIFYTQAKYVEQEKPSLNAAVGFKPAHNEITAAQIEKVGGTPSFGKMLHTDLKYKMW